VLVEGKKGDERLAEKEGTEERSARLAGPRECPEQAAAQRLIPFMPVGSLFRFYVNVQLESPMEMDSFVEMFSLSRRWIR
jgi:hypothetical protein